MPLMDDKAKEAYQLIIKALMHGDEKRKVHLDKGSALAIAGLKEILPDDATDEDIAKVMMAFSYVLGCVQRLPLAAASSFITELVEEYLVGIAVLTGAYTPDPENVPDFTNHDESSRSVDPENAIRPFKDAEWEEQLRKQYL